MASFDELDADDAVLDADPDDPELFPVALALPPLFVVVAADPDTPLVTDAVAADDADVNSENNSALLNVVQLDDAGTRGVYGIVLITPSDSAGCVYVWTTPAESV